MNDAVDPAWEWVLHRPADLTRSRRQLHADVLPPPTGPALMSTKRQSSACCAPARTDRQRPPPRLPSGAVAVTADPDGWLIDVPTPTHDQTIPSVKCDPAHDGLGLHFIA